MVVKHAADGFWDHYFDCDPNIEGLHASHSASTSYSGHAVGLKASYVSHTEALEDCKKINDYNPSGGYGVCQIRICIPA